MNILQNYIKNTLGQKILLAPLTKNQVINLPIFVRESYLLYETTLCYNKIILAEPKDHKALHLQQIEKHIVILKEALHRIIVLHLPEVAAYNRKRLIEKRLNFIVPGKQMYLPDLFMNLQENFTIIAEPEPNTRLLPSAQFLVIYHLTQRTDKWKLEGKTFKELAKILGYTPMAISKAVKNLRHHHVLDVFGEKEKTIRFRLDRLETWNDLVKRDLFVDPVLKRVYVDTKPAAPFLYTSYDALPEYSDMNPAGQQYIAIEKNIFYELTKKQALENVNNYEGQYCVEVWKYDPLRLAENMPNDAKVVDPLSLYLSLKDSKDERVEMALEQLHRHVIW